MQSSFLMSNFINFPFTILLISGKLIKVIACSLLSETTHAHILQSLKHYKENIWVNTLQYILQTLCTKKRYFTFSWKNRTA